MRTIVFATLALAACGQEAAGDTANAEPTVAAADADLSDGLITCAMNEYDGSNSVSVTETFILLGGEVKRYSAFENTAFPLCQAGQEKCSLGLVGGEIRMDYTNPRGFRTRLLVDLSTMTITPYSTRPGGEEQRVSYREGDNCVRQPLPDGLKIAPPPG